MAVLPKPRSKSAILSENADLRARLEEAGDMLRAIARGEADALVIEDGAGPKIYTIQGQEAEANRFRSDMLAQVSDAVIAVDRQDRVIYINPAAERLYGFSNSSALGRAMSEIHGSRWPNAETEAAAERARRERGAWRGECVHVRNDGIELDVEVSITALRDKGEQVGGRLAVIRDVSERRKRQAKVLVSEIRYRRLFETAHDGVLILDPVTRKIVDANPFMTKMLGYPRDDLVGKELFEIGMLRDEAASQEMFRKLQLSFEVRYDDLPLETRSGKHQDVEVVANLYDEDGNPVIQCNIRDITERRRNEEHVKLLMAEVNHRAKNLLAVVQVFANQTAKFGDPATFAARLSDRIDGLAAGQDLLVRNQWLGVEIADLVDAQLSHFKDLIGARFLIEGPRALILNMSAAQGIGMALHELATNAAKYGALSNLDGKVRISWQVSAGMKPIFSVSWREEGGPTVVAPTRKGFGHIVTGRMAEAAVEGQAETAFKESGLSWSLSAPAENAVASTELQLQMSAQNDAS
jgi:PAS domain S-box-containing protein